MLNNIVTTRGFHLLFHLKDYIIEESSIIEIYEIYSGDDNFHYFYFEVNNDANVWIPPHGFIFMSDWIYDVDVVYHGQDYYFKDGRTFVETMAEFDTMEESLFELFLFENVGVNYRSNNFPFSMYQKYLDEHTYKKED